jgi:hypothetical protein
MSGRCFHIEMLLKSDIWKFEWRNLEIIQILSEIRLILVLGYFILQREETVT